MFKSRLLTILSFLLLLSGCAKNAPDDVARRYWEAVIAGDEQAIRQTIVKSASPSLSTVIRPGPKSTVSVGHPERESFAGPKEKEEGGAAEVPTTIHWVDENGKTSTFETETVLVYEEGYWKVDPARTRAAFFDSVYRSALTGLEAALEESAQAFEELGNDISESMARELVEASRELQEQSKKANEELQQFLKNLDEDLRQELEKQQKN